MRLDALHHHEYVQSWRASDPGLPFETYPSSTTIVRVSGDLASSLAAFTVTDAAGTVSWTPNVAALSSVTTYIA
jgi:hypothetical protein